MAHDPTISGFDFEVIIYYFHNLVCSTAHISNPWLNPPPLKPNRCNPLNIRQVNFADIGFLKETPELIATYDEAAGRYFDWRARYGAQFSGSGTGFYAENPTASHRDTDWSRKDVVVLSSAGGSARLVNDEGILNERTLTMDAPGDILGPYLRRASKSVRYKAEDEVEALQNDMPKSLFTASPPAMPSQSGRRSPDGRAIPP